MLGLEGSEITLLPMALLPRIDYVRALRIQEDLARRRAAGEVPDLVWYLEHEPVVTWGSKGGAADHLRRSAEEIRARGIAVLPTTRGGDITFHGPGQLVGYPIVSLGEDRDLHRYLRALEEAIIQALRRWGIAGRRAAGRTGVWVGDPPDGPAKIAAIGVRVSRWVTSHGFALNVDGDLAPFDLIVPCGIADAGVTSISRELARAGRPSPPTEEVAEAVHESLEAALGRSLRKVVGIP
jgi:lipoyl(octanoyl) transferase